MRLNSDRLLSVVLTLAAVAMATAVVKREFFGGIANAQGGGTPLYHEEWEEARSVGIELRNSAAPLQVVLFLDIECSACAAYHNSVIAPFLNSVDSTSYSLVVVHRPLSIHKNAIPAAHAAECAASQGRFLSYVEIALGQQSEFSSSPWTAFAERAMIADLSRFESCLATHSDSSRVASGIALATRMGVNATPTLLINGWELPAPPNLATLQRFVEGAQEGLEVRAMVLRR